MPAVESAEICRLRPGIRAAGVAERKRPALPSVSGPVRHCYLASTEPDPAAARRNSGPAEQGPVPAEQGSGTAEQGSGTAEQGSGTAEPDPDRTRFSYVPDPPLAETVLGSAPSQEATEADRALTAMYDAEYRSLVRMSAVMLGDVGSAEEGRSLPAPIGAEPVPVGAQAPGRGRPAHA
jgi:hypothetical protein